MIAPLRIGMFSAGAFQTADCRETFEELKTTPFGNWFSMTQPTNYDNRQ